MCRFHLDVMDGGRCNPGWIERSCAALQLLPADSSSPFRPSESTVIAQLIPESGAPPITIEREVTVVGRQEDGCDLILEHKSVSKIHCVIVKTDGLLFVRDLLSTNGTRVNGQRITRGALLPGDVLAVANAKFKVHLGPTAAPNVAGPGNETQAMGSLNLNKSNSPPEHVSAAAPPPSEEFRLRPED